MLQRNMSNEIMNLAMTETVIYNTMMLWARAEISLEEFYCLCITSYVDQTHHLRDVLTEVLGEPWESLRDPCSIKPALQSHTTRASAIPLGG